MAKQKASSKKIVKKSAPAKKASARRPVKTAPARKAKKAAPAAPAKAKGKTPAPKTVVKKMPESTVEQGRTTIIKKEKATPPLSKADLNYFRNLLLEKRRELLGDVGSMESEAFKGGSNLSNMPIHMADVGTDNFEQEFTLGLIESERQILREIQEALVRCDAGTFGICQGTNKPIPRVRLEAVPWAKYTIEYSRLLESGKLSRDIASSSDDDGGDDDED
jgi:RNA polymerase-binding transcription factor DksA